MSRLPDPGKGLPPQAADAARRSAWRRPAAKPERDRQRAERVADARAAQAEHEKRRPRNAGTP
jgi:hypothetical protein